MHCRNDAELLLRSLPKNQGVPHRAKLCPKVSGAWCNVNPRTWDPQRAITSMQQLVTMQIATSAQFDSTSHMMLRELLSIVHGVSMFPRFPVPFEEVLKAVDKAITKALPEAAHVGLGTSVGGYKAIVVHLDDRRHLDRAVTTLKKIAAYAGGLESGSEPTFEYRGRMVVIRFPEHFDALSMPPRRRSDTAS